MVDKDHVFSRFQENKPASADRREVLTIPRKAGAPGSRVVEVVHVRPGAAPAGKDRPRRIDPQVRAASWEGGFPARSVAPAPAPVEDTPIETTKPTTHVMPMWEPTVAEADAAPPVHLEEPVAASPKRTLAAGSARARKPARHVADPFDADDDGANCLRCGYAIEPARARRGLLTCAECG